MTNQQGAPEALRLADAIDPFTRKSAPDHLTSKVAADELRRLAALVDSAPTSGNWVSADDVNRLVRELDLALNGKAGAAAQASLCDVVAQVRLEAAKRGQPLLVPQADSQPAPEYVGNGMFKGETVQKAAEHWANWCDVRSIGGVAEFLRFVAKQADSAPVEELDDDACRCEPSDYVRPADYDDDGSVAAMARRAARAPADPQLLKFYGVTTDAELIAAQARHIERLQAKLPQTPSFAPQQVREG